MTGRGLDHRRLAPQPKPQTFSPSLPGDRASPRCAPRGVLIDRLLWIGWVALTLTVVVAGPAAASERRCGWLVNPTPANWWLNDRDGEWELSVQGGYQAPGLDDMPDMSVKGWVATNGPAHGYGCACLTVDVDRTAQRVTRLYRSEPLPLARCRGDRHLAKPD